MLVKLGNAVPLPNLVRKLNLATTEPHAGHSRRNDIRLHLMLALNPWSTLASGTSADDTWTLSIPKLADAH